MTIKRPKGKNACAIAFLAFIALTQGRSLGAQPGGELALDGLGGTKALVAKSRTDASSGGASTGSVKRVKDGSIPAFRWDFRLKSNDKQPFPYGNAWFDGLPLGDFSGWDGILFTARASRPGLPVTFGVGVTDSRTGAWKQDNCSLNLSKDYATYKLPFARFRPAYWSIAEHPDHSGKLDLDRANGLSVAAEGPVGVKVSVFVSGISLYKGEGRGKLGGEISGPVEESIDLGTAASPGADARGTAGGGATARIAVAPDRPFEAPGSHNKGRMNPLLWGTNWGQWLSAFPGVEPTKRLGVKLIRVGGNDMSRYNWRNGLFTDSGSGKARWMPRMEDFVAFCRAAGAEPLIQVNAFGWAPSDEPGHPMEKRVSERDAADLVTFLNGELKLGVKYFEIDNEFEIWAETHRDLRKEAPRADEYVGTFIKYATAMKEAQAAISRAEDIKILGPANCSAWNGWKTEARGDSFAPYDCLPPYFLAACARAEKASGMRLLDVYSFHYYASFRPDYGDQSRFIAGGPAAMLEATQVWWNPAYRNRSDQSLPGNVAWQLAPMYRKWIADVYPGTELAVTEFNLDAASKVFYEPGVREIWQADVYGILAKYGVDYALQFALDGDDRPMCLMAPDDALSPSYWIMQMYASDFAGTVVEASTDKPERLNAYACVRDSGDLVVMVVNKDPARDYRARIEIEGGKLPSFERSFPRLSLTSVRIPAEGGKAAVRTYGLAQIAGD